MLVLPTLSIVCGWPASGKGTVAKGASRGLGLRWIDIDDVRVLNFGPPLFDPKPGEELEKDREQMLGSYRLLIESARINLGLGESLIITATFSRKIYWEILEKELSALPAAPPIEVILCKPLNDGDEEISSRLAKRKFGVNCWSSMNTIRRYHENKDRFIPPPLPHLALDTSPPHTAEQCVEEAIAYIRS